VTPVVAAVIAAVAAQDGGTAIALDDGTVWLVYHREWEELGACDDGEVIGLDAVGAEIAIECGDGTAWLWSAASGWSSAAPVETAPVELSTPRPWLPVLEVSLQRWSTSAAGRSGAPVYEGWVRLRWDL
jgi:hypothetical protein